MKSLYQEVYDFYKRLYPNGVVLFHVGTEWAAYHKDAVRVSDVLCSPYRTPRDLVRASFKYSSLARNLNRLVQAGMEVHLVEYRNNYGVFTLPEVKQILGDIEADY